MAESQDKKIRERVKLLYNKSGLTKEDFAAVCRITRATLHNILNTDKELDEKTLAIIAVKCHVPFEWIMTGEVPSEVKSFYRETEIPELGSKSEVAKTTKQEEGKEFAQYISIVNIKMDYMLENMKQLEAKIEKLQETASDILIKAASVPPIIKEKVKVKK
jgi:transcriptional regulator with XRE-family HTH domain